MNTTNFLLAIAHEIRNGNTPPEAKMHAAMSVIRAFIALGCGHEVDRMRFLTACGV